ncbi:hypothetical protein E3O20_24280 [Salmonella enterica subsp. enterica serovar Java]|nr:hypothetical protein [Salmonella enterica subsp. enterica serovar Java]ECG6886456.1 hypothetical protein [Salmonella enterica subsp. enterica serovar Java]
MFAGKKSAQIREILISESAWEEMTCLFAPSLKKTKKCEQVSPLKGTLSWKLHFALYRRSQIDKHKHQAQVTLIKQITSDGVPVICIWLMPDIWRPYSELTC